MDQRSQQRVSTSIEVEIFGATYNVRGGSDSDHLLELADLVDRKMREVARHTSTVDTTKIAILAALNIADETRREAVPSGQRNEIEETVSSLVGKLEAALEGSS